MVRVCTRVSDLEWLNWNLLLHSTLYGRSYGVYIWGLYIWGLYQSVCQLCIWIQQKFQSVCFEVSQAFSLTHDAVEQENGRTRVAIV